jgi:hypothetical protein
MLHTVGTAVGKEMRRKVQDNSKLLSQFPFIGHGNPDNNLELPCISFK